MSSRPRWFSSRDHRPFSCDVSLPAVDLPTGRERAAPGPALRWALMSTTQHASTPTATYEAAGELLRALAAPVRIAIVVELGMGPKCVHELVQSTGAAQPLVS